MRISHMSDKFTTEIKNNSWHAYDLVKMVKALGSYNAHSQHRNADTPVHSSFQHIDYMHVQLCPTPPPPCPPSFSSSPTSPSKAPSRSSTPGLSLSFLLSRISMSSTWKKQWNFVQRGATGLMQKLHLSFPRAWLSGSLEEKVCVSNRAQEMTKGVEFDRRRTS